MLVKVNSVSIHHKNLQALGTEMCNTSNNVSPTTLNEIFAPRATTCNLRVPVSFKIREVRSPHNGTHSGPKIWSLAPHLVILNQ